MAEFDDDLVTMRRDLEEARGVLSRVVVALNDADLERGRRGGWTVRRVLEHLIQSEWIYVRMVGHLRELPASEDAAPAAPSSVDDSAQQLDAGRKALLAALDGVDEESFYRLRTMGHEEYSILSVLENVSNHDREHAAQIEVIVAAQP